MFIANQSHVVLTSGLYSVINEFPTNEKRQRIFHNCQSFIVDINSSSLNSIEQCRQLEHRFMIVVADNLAPNKYNAFRNSRDSLYAFIRWLKIFLDIEYLPWLNNSRCYFRVNNPMRMRSHRMTVQLEAPHMVSNCGKIGQPIAIQELNSTSLTEAYMCHRLPRYVLHKSW